SAAIAADGLVGEGFGLTALRFRGLRYWFAGVGLLALVLPYGGAVAALGQPAYQAPVKGISLLAAPVFAFPQLRVPKLRVPPAPPRARHAAPTTHAPAPVTSAPTRTRRHVVRRKLPVVSDLHSLTPKASKPEGAPKDPFADVAVVEDAIGDPLSPAALSPPTPAAT